MLQDKKILFISVRFFNYENIIKEKLEGRGAIVDFFDERPSNSILVKGILRIKRDIYASKIKKYYDNLLEQLHTKTYDYFLLIKGEVIPVYFIKKIKKMNPAIKMIYYNYDSFQNNPHALEFLPLFENRFTFDTEDAKRYNLSFRPLFYSDDYKNIRLKNMSHKSEYNIAFIGTAHSDRYIISENVGEKSQKLGLSHFAYYYSQSKSVFYYKSLFDKSFKKFDIKKLSFQTLTHHQIIDIYEKSDCILDINHPGQTGLTMRTFETLGAGKKLITTNQEIKKYKIYKTGNILVIDRKNVKLDPSFFTDNTDKIEENDLYRMSIDGWIDDIFLEENSQPYSWF